MPRGTGCPCLRHSQRLPRTQPASSSWPVCSLLGPKRVGVCVRLQSASPSTSSLLCTPSLWSRLPCPSLSLFSLVLGLQVALSVPYIWLTPFCSSVTSAMLSTLAIAQIVGELFQVDALRPIWNIAFFADKQSSALLI